ncbi:MAG: isochorismatase family protein [Pseudomonadota bacterium]|nr:isochorismatase family protein [Pseudomonadota bacterium]
MIQGSSDLKETLDESGIRNLLITGTKTNVCCEATARDAMMLDYNTVMISDGTAALS